MKFVTAVLLEEVELFLRLHTFGDHTNVQSLAHRDHGRDDCSVASSTRDVLDEGLIDFQSVDREALQVIQRGMPYAKIVDGNAHPDVLQVEKHLSAHGRVEHGRALRDLDLEQLRVKA